MASRIPGFNEVAFTVTPAGAHRGRRYCGVLAATRAQQNRGLMGRRNLAGYAGMVFTWSAPTTTYFYMKDTTLPLSIAWFSASGNEVGQARMDPCPPSAGSCPLYRPSVPYGTAIEVPQGHLASLGIGPGARLDVGGRCRR